VFRLLVSVEYGQPTENQYGGFAILVRIATVMAPWHIQQTAGRTLALTKKCGSDTRSNTVKNVDRHGRTARSSPTLLTLLNFKNILKLMNSTEF